MGIPSFYRHLCRRFPKLITNGSGGSSEWLCLDFNCAMYHVLRQAPTFPSEPEEKAHWEAELCKAIATYMSEIVILAAPTKGVYVSCDGVVCAAKRRQQRLRRFKGPWAAAAEAVVTGKAQTTPGWDQNALTPGSAFMAALGDCLTAAGARLQAKIGVPVIVSTTAEAGEGEHKLMAHMRVVKPASCTIYGLDADLILLAMLLGGAGCYVRLLREAQEFEGSSTGWRSLDVSALASVMIPSCSSQRIHDFVASMSLLGNDFLPKSLTHTVRDDGIPRLIATLERTVWARGLRIVADDGALSRTGMLSLLESWAADEERDLVVAAQAAQKVARRGGIGDSPEETALREWNAQPARWATVTTILGNGALRPDWRAVYAGWHPGSSSNYLQGVAWVWDYYSGRPVDQAWFFDEHLPPLFADVVQCLRTETTASVPPPAMEFADPLPAWVHLLSVLPAASAERLLPRARLPLIAKHAYYWPSSWAVFDVGKTQLWECEPIIPVIPEKLLRSWGP